MAYNLNKHMSETGGQYLSTGMYSGGISRIRKFKANNETVGLEYTFMKDGRTCKGTYWWTPDAMKHLLRLAKSCGLTTDQCGEFSEDGTDLVGKRVSFGVIPEDDPRFHKVRYTWPSGEQAPDVIREKMEGYMAPPPSEDYHEPPDDDDVPF